MTSAESVTVKIPMVFRKYTDDEAVVEVEASSVSEALQEVVRRHDDLEPHIYEDDRSLRAFLNLYVNDEDIRSLAGTDTDLDTGDTLQLLPAISGGMLSGR